jgi:hypothetical protein
MYKLGIDNFSGKVVCVLDIDNSRAIPFDPANADYQAYLKWLSEGNEPLPADEPVVEEPIVEAPLPVVVDEAAPVDEPVVPEPVIEPVVDEPVVPEPVIEPVVEEPAPVVEEPVVTEPAVDEAPPAEPNEG